MGEPRDFYYPLQDDAEDIDRVVHDLVEITDTEQSIDKYVKVIEVEGQPHFSCANVEDSKPIEVDEWEIPVGDGNDWVRQSDVYVTRNKAPFSGDKTLFGKNYHDWSVPSTGYQSKTFYFNGKSHSFYKIWAINKIETDNTNISLSFEDLSSFMNLHDAILTVSTDNKTVLGVDLDEYFIADMIYFDSNSQSISSSDPDFASNFAYGARGLRPKSDSSNVTGLILFDKNGEISLYGNTQNYPVSFYLYRYYNGSSIDTLTIGIDSFSKGKRVGIKDEDIVQYDNDINIDFETSVVQETAIGTYGVTPSLFFGFNVGKKAGTNSGPVVGGFMLKDENSTFHLEGNSLLHVRKNSSICFDKCSLNMDGTAKLNYYDGPGPVVSFIGQYDAPAFLGAGMSRPGGPIFDMKQTSVIMSRGKSQFLMDEGSQFYSAGMASLYLNGCPKVTVNGAPTICINGNAAPGTITCTIVFKAPSNVRSSTFNMTFVPADASELNEFMAIAVNDTGKYSFIDNIFKRSKFSGNSVQHEYTTTLDINGAVVTGKTITGNTLRLNETSHIANNGNPITSGIAFGGNRQAYVMINGGSAVTMQPTQKSDPCFLVNGASSIVMNNNYSHSYNDYENYYYPDEKGYSCTKAALGYGPLILFQEDRFYFTGFGSTGAGDSGAPTFADNISFEKSSLIRNVELENLIKEVKTKGYADYTAQRNGIIHTVWAIGKKDSEDVEGNYFTIENDEKIYLTSNFYKIIGLYFGQFYQGAQEQKFLASNSIIHLGGETGSNSYIRIGANPGEFTEVKILDNSYIETQMNSTLCIKGKDLDNYTWLNIPQDNGGTNVHVLDSATFVMRGVWDDSQAALDDKIPQGLEHLTKKNNTTLFEMTDNAEFRMWGNTKLTIDEVNGITVSDGTTTISFSVADLAAALSGGALLPNAEGNSF